jgi:hypothetical protein
MRTVETTVTTTVCYDISQKDACDAMREWLARRYGLTTLEKEALAITFSLERDYSSEDVQYLKTTAVRVESLERVEGRKEDR